MMKEVKISRKITVKKDQGYYDLVVDINRNFLQDQENAIRAFVAFRQLDLLNLLAEDFMDTLNLGLPEEDSIKLIMSSLDSISKQFSEQLKKLHKDGGN